MSDKVVLVTGSTSGIGEATARRFADAGDRVVFNSVRSVEAGERLAAATPDSLYVQADIAQSEDCTRLVAEVLEHYGRLDVLVNNAGITGPVRDVRDYEGDDIAAVLLTNVVGYVRVIDAFLPLLERSSEPRIVNVSSGLGSFALAHDESRIESHAPSPLYAAAKSAVNMLTVRYAQLLPGMRINSADPGMTATDLSGGQGHSVEHGTDAIVAFALGGPATPTGAYRDCAGDLPW